MQQDLSVAKSLGDIAGECRAHGNLGSAYFSKGSFKEALTSHRYQLVLAMKCKDTQAAASALTSLGECVRCYSLAVFLLNFSKYSIYLPVLKVIATTHLCLLPLTVLESYNKIGSR